jgi:glycosyltransferase involved in cell wall biosynthesis
MDGTASPRPCVLWWSRSGRDYSRNRIVRKAFAGLGWEIVDFSPLLSVTADLEAALWRRFTTPALVWVPCFRQRDAAAATRWSRRHGVPVVFDPLISAYDKQVFERQKFSETAWRARRLLAWESSLLQRCDAVVADTHCHAHFFQETCGVAAERLHVVPVGAEEGLFQPQPFPPPQARMRVLFYGSFIGLQGPEIIAEAAAKTPQVDWTLVGDGPLNAQCREIARNCPQVTFIPWIPYEDLPRTIGEADILLGVFGASRKAGRVIPNKVFQSLACGRVVVTRESDAYPDELRQGSPEATGLVWVAPGSADVLAQAVMQLASRPESLPALGAAARRSYETHLSEATVVTALQSLLCRVVPTSQIDATRLHC